MEGEIPSGGLPSFRRVNMELQDIDSLLHDETVAVTRWAGISGGQEQIDFSAVFPIRPPASREAHDGI